MYTKCLHKWLVPFLQQCEQRNPGTFTTLLRDYIVTKAKTDLALPTKIFEASKGTVSVMVKYNITYCQP